MCAVADQLDELELLREFYRAWVFLHSIGAQSADNPTWTRMRQEMAAQGLVDAHHALQRVKELQ